MKHLFYIFLFFFFGLLQVQAQSTRPDLDFTPDPTPSLTDAFYTQEGGTQRKIFLSDLRDFYMPIANEVVTSRNLTVGSVTHIQGTNIETVFDSIQLGGDLNRIEFEQDSIMVQYDGNDDEVQRDTIRLVATINNSGGGLADGIYGDILVSGSGSRFDLRNSTVNSSVIEDGEVSTDDIATSAVTTDKIAVDAITPDELQATGVTAGAYTSANITIDSDGRITQASNGTSGGGGKNFTDQNTGADTEVFTVTTGVNDVTYSLDNGAHVLTIPASSDLERITFRGDNTSLDNMQDLVIKIDNSANGYDRSFTAQLWNANRTPLDIEDTSNQIVLIKTFSSNVTTITVSNLSGEFAPIAGANQGFYLELR